MVSKCKCVLLLSTFPLFPAQLCHFGCVIYVMNSAIVCFCSNWMILRDADTGKVIWQENKDLSSSEEEHRAQIPTKILDLRAVSREINFSTVESLKNFRLDQKVRPNSHATDDHHCWLVDLVLIVFVHCLQILFKGRIMEEWLFEMGWVCFKGPRSIFK